MYISNIPPHSVFLCSNRTFFSPYCLLNCLSFLSASLNQKATCCIEMQMSGLCDFIWVQAPLKERCMRREGSTQGSEGGSSRVQWMLSLCQLRVLWQHIKEEPRSLVCEPCFVYVLPARNQYWHALLNKVFLQLWLQAASLKSICRQ